MKKYYVQATHINKKQINALENLAALQLILKWSGGFAYIMIFMHIKLVGTNLTLIYWRITGNIPQRFILGIYVEDTFELYRGAFNKT